MCFKVLGAILIFYAPPEDGNERALRARGDAVTDEKLTQTLSDKHFSCA